MVAIFEKKVALQILSPFRSIARSIETGTVLRVVQDAASWALLLADFRRLPHDFESWSQSEQCR
jgi:hypothetical protein